jgi:hypothetical protein
MSFYFRYLPEKLPHPEVYVDRPPKQARLRCLYRVIRRRYGINRSEISAAISATYNRVSTCIPSLAKSVPKPIFLHRLCRSGHRSAHAPTPKEADKGFRPPDLGPRDEPCRPEIGGSMKPTQIEKSQVGAYFPKYILLDSSSQDCACYAMACLVTVYRLRTVLALARLIC